ncbi:MAG: hypothetical protein AAB873_00505 [Patescibacteria group bacterium]
MELLKPARWKAHITKQRKIAENTVDEYNGSEIYIPNIKNLSFSLTNKEGVSFRDVKSVKFNLVGKPEMIWKVDEEKFITSILGIKKKNFNLVLSQFVSIDSAELTLRPFWKMSFPKDRKNIDLLVSYPVR